MHEAVQIVGIANLLLFVLAAIVAVRQWRANPGNRAGLWAAMAFLDLAFVVVFGRLVPTDPNRLIEHVGQRFDIALLVVFPYLLYRFTTAFEPPTLRLERFLALMTAILLAATVALPYYPGEDESRPWWFIAYLVLFLLHWTILLVTVAIRLWRAGSGQPSVARRRMRTLAGAAIVITGALFLAAAGPDTDSGLALAVGLIATASALGFVLGLAPPFLLRLVWRRPEQQQLQLAVTGLMTATTPHEVAGKVLEPLARMVGARRAAIYDNEGTLLAEHGRAPEETGPDVTSVDFQAGRLVVETTAFAPYFGDEERKLLASVASLTGIALDRARLFAQERTAREALEHADELKTQFVALAAHELRSPVATIYGFAQTIRHRGHEIAPERRAELETQLYEQIDRMRELVEQLLDLSRLEADAVEIQPERLVVGTRLREIVAGAVPHNEADVRVDADPQLEATVDARALDRIVSNLLVNAFRYGRPPVVVRAGPAESGLSIVVEDAGPGVSPEFVPQLFERFARGGPQGTGLGLAIARSYARAHRGELVYRPASPHGALFEVVLPAA